ncbi:MAG: DUF3021 domain-containing protein [Bacillales bacterium]|nr:DUF3021 domain-containing protein [Bacillales bacterium]
MSRKGWDCNMNKYVKKFCVRGLIFSGLGPIVLAIIYFILQMNNVDFKMTGFEACLGIVSTYIIAFVHAGSSVFPQIESWGKVKAMFFQLICLYTVYTVFYLINGWIKFNYVVFLIYTGCFILGFLLIWLIVYLSLNKEKDKLNKQLEKVKNK